MPLDSTQKSNHILAVTTRSFVGRQQTVVFVYLASGIYSYVATSVIFRQEENYDPQIPTSGGGKPTPRFERYVIAPLSTNFVGVVYVADTTTATEAACAAAAKYEIIETITLGMVPGGTHIKALLRRLR